MSLICENIGNDGEVSKSAPNSANRSKDVFEDEELDYEEEDEDSKNRPNLKADEDGELSDEDSSNKVALSGTRAVKDKDEGELDDDEELEEGEVKEDSDSEMPENKPDSEDSSVKRPGPLLQEDRNVSRIEAPRSSRNYYSNSYYKNQSSSRSHPSNPDRYASNSRQREYNPPPPPPPTRAPNESAWERGLKQARELITIASKRREEVDITSRERSPLEKRRRLSNSSSEDEIERRHRLAYDAAPWNHSSRSRSNVYSSNRSAETFRDPWRRSKSPKPSQSRSKRPDYDDRYEDAYKRDRPRSDLQKSNSMSSLSSIGSSHHSGSNHSKTSGRKLPYTRPNLDSLPKPNYDDDDLYQGREYVRSKMDRIPKKSNASQYQTNDRHSPAKSFDSWSESLSDSDSSDSYYSNSGSGSDGGADKPSKKARQANEHRMSKSHQEETDDSHKKSKIPSDNKYSIAKQSRLIAEKEAKKAPIKMTFMKKQTSLKKDKLIDEQLNGDLSDVDEMLDSNLSRSPKPASHKSVESISDEESYEANDANSRTDSNSSKTNRREELLLKLRAVEEAIERKLNSQN